MLCMCTVGAVELTISHVNLKTIGTSDTNTALLLGISALQRKQFEGRCTDRTSVEGWGRGCPICYSSHYMAIEGAT